MDKTRTLKILADGSIRGLGTLAPFYDATRSTQGAWILGGGTSYHAEPSVLFTANGKQFTRVGAPKGSFNLRSIHAIDDQRLLVGGQHVLFLSTNGGKTWREVKSTGKKDSGWWSFSSVGGTIWASGNGWVARSEDQGKTWRSTQVPGGDDCYGVVAVSPDEAFVADDDKIHHVEGNKVRVVHKCPGVYVSKIARGSDGTLMAAAHKGKVFLSRDGQKWSALKVPGGRDYFSVVHHNGRFLVGGGQGTLLEVGADGKVAQLAVPKMKAEHDAILSFAPMGEGVMVLAGRDMNGSLRRRGVAIALGALGGTSTAKKAEEAPALPARVKRTLTPPPKRKPTQFETLSLKEAQARFKKLPTCESPPMEVRVFPAMRASELHLDAEPGESLLIIVDGDLYLDGALTLSSCEDDDSYLVLQVRGRVSAQHIALALDPRLEIVGDVEVEELVSCGEGSAFIDVAGRLGCRFAITAPHGSITAQKGLVGMAIGDRAGFAKVKTVEPPHTAARVLSPKFVDRETSTMEPLKLVKGLRKGVAVTR